MDYSKVMIATPMRGSQVQYCVGLMMVNGLYGSWTPLTGQSDIHMARDTLANAFFLNKNFNTLVWIDSDIGFTRQDFLDLLHSTEPIVSGLYTTKQIVPQVHCLDHDCKPVPLEDIPTQGMLRTRLVAGGFLKVEREVLQAIVDKKLVRSCHKGQFHLFYDRRIINDLVTSEDYSFSDLAYEAGYTSWINCGIRVEHDGRKFGC
jgi:hypothetical protein